MIDLLAHFEKEEMFYDIPLDSLYTQLLAKSDTSDIPSYINLVGEPRMLGCVRQYYKMPNTCKNCFSIHKEFGINVGVQKCAACHAKMLEKLKNHEVEAKYEK